MLRKNRFGRGGVFVCQGCDRRTRDAGNGIEHLCPECWELAGLDNQVNDNGGGFDEVVEERDWLFAKAVKQGSNGEAIKRNNSFLWPKGEER